MARGKNAAAAAARRAAQTVALAQALREEISAETEALTVAQAQVAEVAELRTQLAAATAERAASTAAEQHRLGQETQLLASALTEHRRLSDAVTTEWQRTTRFVVEALGGGREGLEQFMAIVDRHSYLADPPGGAKVDIDAITRLQVVRGQRRPSVAPAAPTDVEILGALLPLLPGSWRTRLAGAGLTLDELLEHDPKSGESGRADEPLAEDTQRLLLEHARAAERVLRSSPNSLAVGSVSAWYPLPLLALDVPWDRGVTEPARRLREPHPHVTGVFGALGAAADARPGTRTAPADEHEPPMTGPWPAPTPALPATTRQRLAETSAEELLRCWHDPLRSYDLLAEAVSGGRARPWMPPPRTPLPGYASTIRNQYAKAAIGAWARLDAHPQGGAASPAGEAAVALTCAAPFWMPAGQTHAFADSEPIDERDLEDLLLPFPQVLLTFAEPLELPAPALTDDERRQLLGERGQGTTGSVARRAGSALADLDMALVKLLREHDTSPDLNDLIAELADPTHLGVVSVGQALALRGGRVEAVLLLADALGRLEEQFAWCIAVPGKHAGVLARIVVPASLTTTSYRAQLLNLAAVVAWAGWHEPDTDTALPPRLRPEDIDDLTRTPAFRRDANRAGAGGVRVLDVKATLKTSTGGETTGRHVAPHVRRGHWRRQRHGPGARQVKRIRIAPVTVNAHLGDTAPRVYRLPEPAPPCPTASTSP